MKSSPLISKGFSFGKEIKIFYNWHAEGISLIKKVLKKPHFPYEKIVILGFSGAGKSTFTKALAPYLSSIDGKLWTSVDLDDELFFHNKMTGEKHLGELIERIGLKNFRLLEKELVFKIIDSFEPPFVISLGGGAFSLELYEFLNKKKEVLTVFLNTPFETCYSRIKNDSVRPLTKLGNEGLRALYFERLPLYQKAMVTLQSSDPSFVLDFMPKTN